MAGRRNPEFVQGLEIVKCKEGKLSRLSEGEIVSGHVSEQLGNAIAEKPDLIEKLLELPNLKNLSSASFEH